MSKNLERRIYLVFWRGAPEASEFMKIFVDQWKPAIFDRKW